VTRPADNATYPDTRCERDTCCAVATCEEITCPSSEELECSEKEEKIKVRSFTAFKRRQRTGIVAELKSEEKLRNFVVAIYLKNVSISRIVRTTTLHTAVEKFHFILFIYLFGT